MKPAWVHPTAIIEDGVELGEGTKVWDNVHIRHDALVGKSCIVGEKTYIAYGVTVGDFVKINAGVYICAKVTIEDFCMLSAHVVFTNDRFPRAGNLDLTELEVSSITDESSPTRVCRGATIGANATVGPGLTIGPFAMVGMGAVVTRDVARQALVVGNPARLVGWVCQCGSPLARVGDVQSPDRTPVKCSRCGCEYALAEDGVILFE